MPLPPPVERQALHRRQIDLQGFRRNDGLYDIEARMVDTKADAFRVGRGQLLQPGEAIHDMAIRLVIDEALTIVDVAASTDAAPQHGCAAGPATLKAIKGLRIGPGWTRAVRERLAGARGCTHLRELLGPLATVAYQTTWQARAGQAPALDANGRPRKIDSCLAYASDGELVRKLWPLHFRSRKDAGIEAGAETRTKT